MLNGTILDVAVGLLFVFLLLSVACSLLNERIQSMLDKRAVMLEQSLRALLGGGKDGLFARVKDHALVRGLGHAPAWMPSYLPASTFALALFDALVPADGEHPQTFRRLREAVLALPDSVIEDLAAQRSWLGRLLDAILRRAKLGPQPVPTARAALLALLDAAEGDVAAARLKVEGWFDSAMSRLSGVYKRHIGVWLFVLGFVFAAGTNADAILLVQRLEHETALRAAVTQQASQEVQAMRARGDTTGATLKIDPAQLNQIELLFWENQVVSAADAAEHPRAMRQPEWSPQWLRWALFKLIGFLMTAFAVSLGAPFWFDLLGRLVNLRATGAKPPSPPTPPLAPAAKPA